MYSSLISKVEKAKRYAEEPQRVTIQQIDVRFRGDNDSHKVSLHGDEWKCEASTSTLGLARTS